jgi:hypothetical protein
MCLSYLAQLPREEYERSKGVEDERDDRDAPEHVVTRRVAVDAVVHAKELGAVGEVVAIECCED